MKKGVEGGAEGKPRKIGETSFCAAHVLGSEARLTDDHAHFRVVEPMHHPDRLACLHERPRIIQGIDVTGIHVPGCYLNFPPRIELYLDKLFFFFFLIGIGEEGWHTRVPVISLRCYF